MKLTREGWKGFALLAAINLGAVALPFVWQWLSSGRGAQLEFVVVFFPVLQWAWSLPMLLVAHHRSREEYASGLTVAAGLSMLLGCGCWALVLFGAR